MGFFYWIRVVVMGIGLVAVILAIRHLNRVDPRQPLAAVTSPVAKLIVGTGDTERITLCPTRVAWLETSRGLRIRENHMKWLREANGTQEELNPIAMEKWLGRNCSVRGQRSAVGQSFQPVLRFGFVSGAAQTLGQAPSGEFEWQGSRFVSSDLEEAVRALMNLPIAKAPGQN